MTGNIITLITDFGYKDPYVASMKGVILSINPKVSIVDISHEIHKHDIRAAAILLWASYKYFPPGTIHIVVVDPGVGTTRKGLIVKSRRYYFVGPDNGVLTLASNDDNVEKIVEIKYKSKYTLSKISYTFHGRDVFAPVAAYLSTGIPIDRFGSITSFSEHITIPKYKFNMGKLSGEIIYIDRFGNAVTNISASLINNKILKFNTEYKVVIDNNTTIYVKLVPSYGYVNKGQTLLAPNSFDLIELAINGESASKRYNLMVGSKITIELR